MWNLVLYHRPRCPLCSEARFALREFARTHDICVKEIDISQDEGLWERYRYEIPVLESGGVEIARHHIGAKKLTALHRRWQEGRLHAKPDLAQPASPTFALF